MISDKCSQIINITPQDKRAIDTVYTYMIEKPGQLNFKQNFTCIVIQFTLVLIIMLEKTQGLGELIMMILHMVDQFRKFIFTFGLLIVLFIMINLTLKNEFKQQRISFLEIMQDILNAFYGKPEFSFFTQPDGQLFIMLFVYVFNILLVSFLVAMFINRYSFLWGNLDALKRMNIIKLKNTSDYDPLYGGVTITFFPISLIILPFIPFVVLFKSQRLNEFILKM